MPEGPEVETIRRGLAPVFGAKILEVIWSDHRKYINQDFDKLRDNKISGIERKAKFLIWRFDKGIFALNHLGMTGVWHLYSDKTWKSFVKPFDKFNHYKLYLKLEKKNEIMHLLFIDVRIFGQFQLMSGEEITKYKSIKDLGPDILDEDFNSIEFLKRIRRRTKAIGPVLLEPKVVAGCGNIYKSESLFRAGINPMIPANELSDEQVLQLGEKLNEVGLEALANKGSSLKDFAHVDGYKGLMQNKFNVYGRAGEECYICGTEILKEVLGGRSTFFCPTCQQ